jgi:hypothetical protein
MCDRDDDDDGDDDDDEDDDGTINFIRELRITMDINGLSWVMDEKWNKE